MSKRNKLIPSLKEFPLGTLSGAAQDNVEMRIARSIREGEQRLGQPLHTLNIPDLVAAENKRHGFVEPGDVQKFAANVSSAYDYVTTQSPLGISRAGYLSYQAEGVVKAVEQVVQEVGTALGLKPNKA